MSVEINESSNSKMEAVTQPDSVVPNQGRPNPMLNSVVLQTLFEYISIKEIKTYRQVCRLWYDESLPRWRRDVWMRLDDDKKRSNGLDDYLDMINGGVSSEQLQFREYPYRKYKLSKLKPDFVGDRQLEFWRKCGPNITHLEISKSCFHSVRQFEALLYRFVPNLEFLHLKRNTVATNGLPEDESNLMDAPPQSKSKVFKELQLDTQLFFTTFPRLSVDWFWLLEQFPQIQSVSIATYDFPYSHRLYSPAVELDQILNAMITLATEQGISWKLEKLDLLFMGGMQRTVFQNNHSELFRQLQLPLTTLSLHVGSATTGTALKTMLETCAFTLRKLVVYRHDLTTNVEVENDDLTVDFPYGVQLDSLSELWLSGRLLCESLNFLPFTPNLTSLILAQDIGNSLGEDASRSHFSGFQTFLRLSSLISEKEDNEYGHLRRNFHSVIADTDFSRLEKAVFPKLKEFILSGREQSVSSPAEVAALTRLMPNLKTLMLGLENDGFRVVCDRWKQLEALIIQPYLVNQFGLTGSVPFIGQRLPNLTDLTSLRYFGMGFGTSYSFKTALTEESVLNAIFPLKNLQRITGYYNLNKMSEDVRDQLLSKFRNNWIFHEGRFDSEWRYGVDASRSSDSEDEDE